MAFISKYKSSKIEELLDKASSGNNVDLSEYPKKTEFKTINNQSIIGSGNITIEGGGTAEDNRYFTDFTVEVVKTACEYGTNIWYDNVETSVNNIIEAVKNNKIICIPYRDFNKGYLIATYKYNRYVDDYYINNNADFQFIDDNYQFVFTVSYNENVGGENNSNYYLRGSHRTNLSLGLTIYPNSDGYAYIEAADGKFLTLKD